MMSLVLSTWPDGRDPWACEHDSLARMSTQRDRRIDELLPHRSQRYAVGALDRNAKVCPADAVFLAQTCSDHDPGVLRMGPSERTLEITLHIMLVAFEGEEAFRQRWDTVIEGVEAACMQRLNAKLPFNS